MALTNCQKCGKLFNRTRDRICPTCVSAEDDEFELVCTYMRENKVFFVVELAEETGVDRAKILKWVEEGKLELPTPPAKSKQAWPRCTRCGHRVEKENDLCQQCSKELAEQIARQRAAQELSHSPTKSLEGAPPVRSGMHNTPRGE